MYHTSFRASAPAPPVTALPSTAPQRAPLSYTPPYLTEKILDARLCLEGERKQVTAAIALYQTLDMTLWLPQAEAALAQVA